MDESWTVKKAETKELMLLNCGVVDDSWESLGLQGDPGSPSWRRSVLGVHWKDWWWSWNSNTLVTSYEELTHWKRPWCWEGLGAGGEGEDRGWDGWMASLTWWTWVSVNFRSWWWTGRPGVLRFMGLQRVGHDWENELNWTEGQLNFTEIKTYMLVVHVDFSLAEMFFLSVFFLSIRGRMKVCILDCLWRGSDGAFLVCACSLASVVSDSLQPYGL